MEQSVFIVMETQYGNEPDWVVWLNIFTFYIPELLRSQIHEV